jgi:sugar/nucleoside kinase (ribokinase family)
VLGDNELSEAVVSALSEEGIDLSWLRRQAGVRPIHAVVIVERTRPSRTIFYNLEGACGALTDWPAADVIRAARVLLVDHFGVEGMLRATRIARDAGIPVVADFESDEGPGFHALLGLVDHLIVSEDFARRLTGEPSPAGNVDRLWSAIRETVVVTCGSEGCWWRAKSDAGHVQHQPAFAVKAVDTTGCGDVFHGAYASALARGLEAEERIRLASAAAAVHAARRGGQVGIPSLSAVESFARQQCR